MIASGDNHSCLGECCALCHHWWPSCYCYRLPWEQPGGDDKKPENNGCHGESEDSRSQQEGNRPEATLNTNLNSNNINCDHVSSSQNGIGVFVCEIVEI